MEINLFLCPHYWRNIYPDQLDRGFLVFKLSDDNLEFGKNTAILSLNEQSAPFVEYSKDGSFLSEGIALLKDSCSITGILEDFLGNIHDQNDSLFPLFLIINDDKRIYTYSATALHEAKILFLNPCPEVDSELKDATFIENLFLALSNHHKHRLSINNHNNHTPFLKKMSKGFEIEYKLTLDSEQDIWKLSKHFHKLIADKLFPPFIIHWMTQFMLWEIENHLFEVLEPEERQGYISFITLPNGKYVLKKKFFNEDSLVREETSIRDVEVKGTFDDYIVDHFPDFVVKKHAPFKRIRYDIDFESLNTGNHFSIMFDRSSLQDSSYASLVQCEIEYMGSRTIGETQLVYEELAEILKFVKENLDILEISYEESFYSKLSYLRDYQKFKNASGL